MKTHPTLRYCWLLLSTVFLISLPSIPVAATPSSEAGERPAAMNIQINLNPIASGPVSPVQITHAGDGSGRLFIVEQAGRIKIMRNGSVLPTPFLNISNLVSCCGERGLVGLAFHPNYEQNGYFYVDYTRASDGAIVVARYRVMAGQPDTADPASALILLTIAKPYENHNGGQLAFGPLDGYLYISTGDSGSGGDPLDAGQDINSLLGKILRIDVDHGSPYTSPAGNPFVGKTGLDQIWAYGLRNPWRFSFDRQTGDLFIGDVGQNTWEEIDFQAAGTPGGVNFGWRCREGLHNFNFEASCQGKTLTDPIAEYNHTVGASVTGGFVYRGINFPALTGRYFYADFIEGKIWSMYQTTNPAGWSTPELEVDTGLYISTFGEDEQGELYLADYGSGTIYRLEDANGPIINLSNSRKQVFPASANPGETVRYTIQISNTGALLNIPVVLTDTLPAGLVYIPGSLQASHGSTSAAAAPVLTWQGNLNASQRMTITYQANVTGVITGSLVNQAVLASAQSSWLTLAVALDVPRPVLTTTKADFFFPGTQPGELSAPIPNSLDCDTCHSAAIYDLWRGSMMSLAGRDPLFWAALHTANADAPGAGEFCLRCHAPKGWYAGRSSQPDGSTLEPEDIHNGVACEVCHRTVDPVPSPSDQAAVIDAAIRSSLTEPVPNGWVGSGAIILDPQDRRRGPFAFATPLPYHSTYQTDLLAQSGDAVTHSRICGSCHNVSNPVLSWDAGRGQFWPNSMNARAPSFSAGQLFPVETTFDEWLYSDYARLGVYAPQFAGSKPGGIVRSCQDCHMPRSVGYAADTAFNPVLRDCLSSGCLPEHTLTGANTWVPKLLQNPFWRLSTPGDGGRLNNTIVQAQSMLQKAATLTVTIETTGSDLTALVRVTNQTGHKLPTGYAEGRQMWLHLRAFDAQGQLVYESGRLNPLSGLLERDTDARVYEIKQGLTPELAAVLGLPPGESFHFVLNNTVIKDNRIPPRGYTPAMYNQPGLRPVGASYGSGQYWDEVRYNLPPGTASVMVFLYYQTAAGEYVDFLRRTGGLDGQTLGQMWENSKSPPVLMAAAYWPSYPLYLTLIRR